MSGRAPLSHAVTAFALGSSAVPGLWLKLALPGGQAWPGPDSLLRWRLTFTLQAGLQR